MHFIIWIKKPLSLYYIVTHTHTCVCVCVCVCDIVTIWLQFLTTCLVSYNCLFDRIIYLTYAINLTGQLEGLVNRAN